MNQVIGPNQGSSADPWFLSVRTVDGTFRAMVQRTVWMRDVESLMARQVTSQPEEERLSLSDSAQARMISPTIMIVNGFGMN